MKLSAPFTKLIICFVVLIISAAVLCDKEIPERRRRVRTTTTTTSAPEITTPSISERELILLKREEAFRVREENFREREVNLTLREHGLKDREYLLSVREDNVAEREKNSGGHGLSGVETTPKPDLHLVRLDPSTMKYYEIGSTDPCPQNMRFFAVPDEDSNEGRCDCDYHQCSRPLIYSADYNQCFWAWSQGPCEQNHWYTFNETLHPVCELNDCPAKSLVSGVTKYVFKDLEDGECYETTTKGYCEMDNERLLTTPEDPLPKCRTHTLCAPTTVPPQQICLPGNRRTAEGFCNNI